MTEYAFPTDGNILQRHLGMTLRDYFAAKAMQGLLAGQYRDSGDYNLSELPEEAYRVADAMMEARK